MFSVYNIKPKFQQLLMPALRFLQRLNVSANQITLASIALSFFIGFAFWHARYNAVYFLALPVGLFLRMALNALDGMMARIHNQQSKVGEVLNEMGDIVSDTVIYFPLIIYMPEHIYLVFCFIVLSIINEFAGLLGKVVSGVRRYEGPMGKSDRALLFGLYGLLAYFSGDIEFLMAFVLKGTLFLLLLSTFVRLKKSTI